MRRLILDFKKQRVKLWDG